MTASMRYFDCHSHFSTKAGLHHATQEDYEQAQRVFKRKRTFETEEQMADDSGSATFAPSSTFTGPGG